MSTVYLCALKAAAMPGHYAFCGDLIVVENGFLDIVLCWWQDEFHDKIKIEHSDKLIFHVYVDNQYL